MVLFFFVGIYISTVPGYCTVLYCTRVRCTVLYSTVQYSILYCTVLFTSILCLFVCLFVAAHTDSVTPEAREQLAKSRDKYLSVLQH